MGIRLKHCKPPAAAKTVPIGEKRKRGRPAKAKAALGAIIEFSSHSFYSSLNFSLLYLNIVFTDNEYLFYW